MIFSDTNIDDDKITINILDDSYSIFNRQIYWLEKMADYDYFPNIVDIDYINKIIECDYKTFSNKKLKTQLEEIESILTNNNCQLNNLTNNDILIKNNTIIIVNMFWCIDLSININQDINYWNVDDNTSSIDRIDFMKNSFLMSKILSNKGIDILLDDITFILFLENFEQYLNYKTELLIILNYCNYIVINNNDDVYKLKLEVSSRQNKIDIIFNDSKSIFENIELFKYICQSKVDKKILVNMNISNNHKSFFLDTKKILENIKNENDVGILYQSNMNKYVGVYGDLNECLEIQKICYDNDIDFSNYISDEKELIDWYSYQDGLDLKEKKMHWLNIGINSDLNLPIKKESIAHVPQISIDNNFAIDFQLYKQFFKKFNYNENYSRNSYIYFFFYLVSAYDKKYKMIE